MRDRGALQGWIRSRRDRPHPRLHGLRALVHRNRMLQARPHIGRELPERVQKRKRGNLAHVGAGISTPERTDACAGQRTATDE